ncbi:MAG: right-handed parallel beta-helix repeat-containing protein, partial [Planctomycetes bacterium]|nr:right-handed parallel beta-helix repeat-containing protein [Planctomycetota bacterium]
PEQALDAARAGPASDVWSLGASLYEALTLVPPFGSDDPLQVLRRVTQEPPVAPRKLDATIPRDLETVVLAALEKDPARRYPSAAALAADLDRFLAREPVRARPAGRARRLAAWALRRPAAATLLAGVLLALGALGAEAGLRARRARAAAAAEAAAALQEGRDLEAQGLWFEAAIRYEGALEVLETGEGRLGLEGLSGEVRRRLREVYRERGLRLLEAGAYARAREQLLRAGELGAEDLVESLARARRASRGEALLRVSSPAGAAVVLRRPGAPAQELGSAPLSREVPSGRLALVLGDGEPLELEARPGETLEVEPLEVPVRDPATLERALAAARSGHRLVLAGGIYPGPIEIAVPGLSVEAADPADPPLVDASGHDQGVRVHRAAGARVAGLRVRGARGAGILVEDSPAARVESCTVRECGAAGVRAVRSAGLRLVANRCRDVPRGLDVESSDGARLEGNHCRVYEVDGVRVSSSAWVQVRGNTLGPDTPEEAGEARDAIRLLEAGVVLVDCDRFLARGNRATGAGLAGLLLVGCPRGLALENRLLGNLRSGIRLEGTEAAQTAAPGEAAVRLVSNAVVATDSPTPHKGVWVEGGGRLVLEHNAMHWGRTAVDGGRADRTRLRANLYYRVEEVLDTGTAPQDSDGNWVWGGPRGSGMRASYAGMREMRGDDDAPLGLADWQRLTGLDASTVEADPLYLDPERPWEADFELAHESPLRDLDAWARPGLVSREVADEVEARWRREGP